MIYSPSSIYCPNGLPLFRSLLCLDTLLSIRTLTDTLLSI